MIEGIAFGPERGVSFRGLDFDGIEMAIQPFGSANFVQQDEAGLPCRSRAFGLVHGPAVAIKMADAVLVHFGFAGW
jgi:hypothetical protein